jgi:hypothetical protein
MNTYYKWFNDKDTFCSCVFDNPSTEKKVANYYKNGKLYANHQGWITQKNDIEITETEFNKMIGIN